MKIRKTFVGNLPDNKIVNSNSTSETDTYSCKYLNERNVIVSSEEPTTGEEVWIRSRGKNLLYTPYTIDNKLTKTSARSDHYWELKYKCYLEKGKKYNFSYESDDNTGNVESYLFYNFDQGNYFASGGTTKSIGFTAPITGMYKLRIDVNTSGTTASFWNFQVEEGNEKTSFEKAIPIKLYIKNDGGQYEEFTKTVSCGQNPMDSSIWFEKGKNLFDGIIESGGLSLNDGSKVDNSSRTRSANYIKVSPSTTYTIQRTEKTGFRWCVGYNSKKEIIKDGNLKNNEELVTSAVAKINAGDTSGSFTTTPTTEYIRWYDTTSTNTNEKVQIEKGEVATPYESYTPKKIHTNNGSGYEEFYNEDFINQIKESMKYLNGYIYSFNTIYYSANTDTVNDANKFVSGLHVIDTNVTIANRPSKKHNTLEAVLVFTGNPNGSGDNGIQIWFNGVEVVYIRLKLWGSYTGWKQISVV